VPDPRAPRPSTLSLLEMSDNKTSLMKVRRTCALEASVTARV
jgi:hypothetical protein